MAWIQSHQELKDHPKAIRLARLMSWTIPETVGRLHFLWWWAINYAESGQLDKFTETEIAQAMNVAQDNALLLMNSLCESKFIDVVGVKKIHDWWDYSGNYLRSKYKRSPKKWKQVRNLYVTVTSRLRNRIDKIREDKIRKDNIPPIITPLDLISELQSKPAFKDLNVEEQFYKCQAWCEANRRQLNKRMFTNWLIKADKPLHLSKKGPYID